MGCISHESNRKSKSPRWHVEFKNWWREYLLCLKVYLNISNYQQTKNDPTISTQGRKMAESPCVTWVKTASLWDKNLLEISNKNSVRNGAEWHSTDHLGCVSLRISASGNIKGSAGRVRTGLFSLSNAWLTLLCCLWSRSPFYWDINLLDVNLKFFIHSSIEDISFAYSFQWLWMKLPEIFLYRFLFEVDRLNQDMTSEHSCWLGPYFA